MTFHLNIWFIKLEGQGHRPKFKVIGENNSSSTVAVPWQT